MNAQSQSHKAVEWNQDGAKQSQEGGGTLEGVREMEKHSQSSGAGFQPQSVACSSDAEG